MSTSIHITDEELRYAINGDREDPNDRLLGCKDVADLISVHRRTVERAHEKGVLVHACVVSGAPRYWRSHVLRQAKAGRLSRITSRVDTHNK